MKILASIIKHFRYILVFFVLTVACQKEIVYEENPALIKKNELVYTELKALDPVVTVDKMARLKAVASGDSLVFQWFSEEGIITATDTLAFFSSDIDGVFSVSCQISDKYGNSEIKEVEVRVTSELVFTALESEEETIPVGFRTTVTATASGEEIEYQWSADGGTLEGEGSEVVFFAGNPGEYKLTCTVTDLAGESQFFEIIITVVEGFVFKALVASPDRVNAHENSYLTAKVLGEGLSFQWRCDPPAFLAGSGSSIIFNICHGDRFTVSCEVTDKEGNSETKSVLIIVDDI
ncbi:MAG: hypothetical protein EA361_04050 [Bacteroidetes bacterium]|nr:MAG: hypothetical protein EA361_04050 [Bacteroidota bacterium]